METQFQARFNEQQRITNYFTKKGQEIKNEGDEDAHSVHAIHDRDPSSIDQRINKLEPLLRSSQLFGNQFIDPSLCEPISKGKFSTMFSLHSLLPLDIPHHLWKNGEHLVSFSGPHKVSTWKSLAKEFL